MVSKYRKDVSKQQEPLVLLDVSTCTIQGNGLYLHISRLQEPVLLLGLSTL